MSEKIKSRERDAILQSLKAGVVPRIGLRHIQVGRKDEVTAILDDFNRIENGGATIRFIIGKYGSGKSFFLNLSRIVAIEKKFVVLQADITPDRRLHASGGQARMLYSELMQNMSIKSKPDGGALTAVVEKWVSDIDFHLRKSGASDSDIEEAIIGKLKKLQDLVSGYDFATVLYKYYEGFQKHDDHLIASALRWLKAEYTTKTEAKKDLGVRSIIDDLNVYEYLKLFAAFVRIAGYSGLLINIDEMGVLSHRLNSSQARNANYEMLLRIVNDCLQGNVSGIGFIFGGTDSFLDDKRRGLASYEALATRLADNEFADEKLKDYSGPIIRLANLTTEELFVLLHNIRNVQASGDPSKYIVPDEALKGFMNHCSRTLGFDFFRTPRDVAKSFTGFLSVLEQNPEARWNDLIESVKIEKVIEVEEFENDKTEIVANHTETNKPEGIEPDDELVTFRL